MLRPGGTLTVLEGDHGSAYLHPNRADAQHVMHCRVELQRRLGGDAEIGRRPSLLLAQNGVRLVRVSPRAAYVAGSRPKLARGVVLNTFTAMIEGVREQVPASELADTMTWERGVAGL